MYGVLEIGEMEEIEEMERNGPSFPMMNERPVIPRDGSRARASRVGVACVEGVVE